MSEEYPPHKSFEEMDLSTNLLRGIFSFGWEYPSEIQQKTIVPITARRDIIAQAQSGTGKTGAFSISALQCIDWSMRKPQVIMISPTRELALQTHQTARTLGSFLFNESSTKCACLIGGTSVGSDIQLLRSNNIMSVSGTPGRVFDILSRKVISFGDLKLVVIDEADEMLSAGFQKQITDILELLPKTVHGTVNNFNLLKKLSYTLI